MKVTHNTTNFIPLTFILIGIPGLEEHGLWLSIPFVSVYLLSLLGNCILLFILKTDRSLHGPMYFLLSLLAANDLALPSTTVPRMLGIFWLGYLEISFAGCLTQMFFVYSFLVVESGILVAMAFDRYVAICYPLRYSSLLTSAILEKIATVVIFRAVIAVLPFALSLSQLSYCKSSVISHSYCDHMAVAKVACGDVRFDNILGLVVSLSISGFDLLAIGMSYVMILNAILRLPSKHARHKAFSTCGAHVFVILIFYTPAVFNFATYRFGQKTIPHHTHVVSANFHILVPSMLNPVVYGIKTKLIRQRVVHILHKGGLQFWRLY
ncbi:olfactory receptor 52J3-like [Pleurodeles waltl]|uniref:olfactory receptor 52J3-like n=1 Tax=Pleurodeles waltl TaxID=8319 RepID=UPI0037096DA7